MFYIFMMVRIITSETTIFGKGNLALVKIQVASNSVMHGKLLQRHKLKREHMLENYPHNSFTYLNNTVIS